MIVVGVPRRLVNVFWQGHGGPCRMIWANRTGGREFARRYRCPTPGLPAHGKSAPSSTPLRRHRAGRPRGGGARRGRALRDRRRLRRQRRRPRRCLRPLRSRGPEPADRRPAGGARHDRPAGRPGRRRRPRRRDLPAGRRRHCRGSGAASPTAAAPRAGRQRMARRRGGARSRVRR